MPPSTILDQYGRPFERTSPARRAGYDAAKTTKENYKHWSHADALAPVSQLTPAVRKTLRDRCRYEVLNNCYLAGMVRTLVTDTVGTGARLQMTTPDENLNSAVNDLWASWSTLVDWPLKTRIMAGVRYVAGECFGVKRESKRLDQLGHPVTLDVRLIEPDQVTDGVAGQLFNPTGDDGIVCDSEGEVVAYKILRTHPGDNRNFMASFDPDKVDARNVVHWFCPERPGQLRGVTPLASCLPIAAQLRRFTAAVLSAAEFAASVAGVLESDLPADSERAVTAEEYFDTVEIVRGMLLTLPSGTKASPFKSEQPTTNYEMFVKAKLRELGRPVSMPFGKVAGDHSSYNYSSGRMDDAPYWTERDIERQALEAKVFDPILFTWLDLAKLAIPALVQYEGQWWKLRHKWHYPARPVFDPVKDASGDELNLTNGTDTLAAIAARDGMTVDELLDQRAREKAGFESRGLPLPPWMNGTPAPARTADGQPQPQEAASAS